MSRSRKQGFTLTELLVVIAIIGVLAALLIPAVQAAREAARRAQCTNQLSQLAKAATNFESSKGYLPLSQDALLKNAPAAGNAAVNQRWVTWFVQLAPYMDQKPVYDSWNSPSGSGLTPLVPILICPSKRGTLDTIPANSYIANGGFYPRNGIDSAFYSGSPPAAPFKMKILQRKANGVFMDRANANLLGPSVYGGQPQTISLSDLTDGASNTAFFSESITASPWPQILNQFTVPSSWTVDPIYPVPPLENIGSTVMVWLYVTEPGRAGVPNKNPVTGANIPVSNVQTHMKINGKGTPSHPAEIWRPSSYHSGGVIMSFADGSTRFISEKIPYHIYQSLLTPDNKRSDMPENSYVMASGDLD